eukprot:PhF_6_TR6236/c0_g1_i1/m.9427
MIVKKSHQPEWIETYEHYAVCPSFFAFLKFVVGMSIFFGIIVKIPWLRNYVVQSLVPGSGPTLSQLNTESCKLQVILPQAKVKSVLDMSHIYRVTACAAVTVVQGLLAALDSKTVCNVGVVTPVQALGGERLFKMLKSTSDFAFSVSKL